MTAIFLLPVSALAPIRDVTFLLAAIHTSFVHSVDPFLSNLEPVLHLKYDFQFQKPQVDTGCSLLALQSFNLITGQSVLSLAINTSVDNL